MDMREEGDGAFERMRTQADALTWGRGRERGQFQVSARVLAITLALTLWMATGSLVLAILEGLGEHPLRRLAIGLGLVLSVAVALWQRNRVCVVLRTHPWLVVPVAAAQLCAAVADKALGGPYVAVTVTSLGLAAVVARPRTVWACVAVLDVGYAVAVLAERSPAALVDSGQLAGVLGALLGYPFAALVVLGLAGLFRRFVSNAEGVLDDIRAGAAMLTPALWHALQLSAGPTPGLLPAPPRFFDLTRDEIKIIDGLARGARPKQIAFAWGVSLAKVRKHIQDAKRKTGARTLPELAAITASPDWSRLNDVEAA
jgi:DNA-binding NarL/FixJ family response regulator